MKKIMSSRATAALVLALATSLFSVSCSNNPSVASTAKKLNSATATEVISYNDSLSPKTREFASFGALPDTVKRAMTDYIKTGEWQTVNYAYPQSFVHLQSPNGMQDSFWAVCIDTRGNLTGILPTRDARSLKTVGAHQMIVNKTPRSAGLSYAILKGLQPSDSFRQGSRQTKGLDTPAPVAPVKVVVPAAPKAPVAPVAAPAAPAAPATPEAPATEEATPAAEGEGDVFGGGTETESTTTETETPAGETETTTTEEVTF